MMALNFPARFLSMDKFPALGSTRAGETPAFPGGAGSPSCARELREEQQGEFAQALRGEGIMQEYVEKIRLASGEARGRLLAGAEKRNLRIPPR